MAECSSCHEWLHQECLIHEALSKTWKATELKNKHKKKGKAKGHGKKHDKNSVSVDDPKYKARLTGTVVDAGKKVKIDDLKKYPGDVAEGETMETECLVCKKIIV